MNEDVLSVKYSVDGKFLAVALLDSTVKVFFVDTLKVGCFVQLSWNAPNSFLICSSSFRFMGTSYPCCAWTFALMAHS
jgi:WD40 repeat protein